MDAIKKTFDDLSRSVKEARDWVLERATAGEAAECPCCGKAVGYEQRLERLHAVELLRLYEEAQALADRWDISLAGAEVHVPTQLGGTASSYSQNCISMLKHFGLVKSKKPGWWSLTKTGVGFVRGEVPVPKAVWLFKGERIKFIGEAGAVMLHDLVHPSDYNTKVEEAVPA